MNDAVLQLLCCAVCRGTLGWKAFLQQAEGGIENGVAWCEDCRGWYPIEDGLLELLPDGLAYHEDRKNFQLIHREELRALGLEVHDNGVASNVSAVEPQLKQQRHFDWYAANEKQTYNSYEQLPLWRAVDEEVLLAWPGQIQTGSWILEVGCAQGRATFKFTDLPLNIVGFDISKALVRQAMKRYRQEHHRASATFFVADGSRLPFKSASFDHVLVYGVLHHLPDPAETCREVARVLRPGGTYFGLENNQSVFRKVFDWLMKINPLWHEEAGAQPLISAEQIRQWFAGSGMQIECGTRVFLPPHVVNWLGNRWGAWLFRACDAAGRRLPWLRRQGGLIEIHGRRLMS